MRYRILINECVASVLHGVGAPSAKARINCFNSAWPLYFLLLHRLHLLRFSWPFSDRHVLKSRFVVNPFVVPF